MSRRRISHFVVCLAPMLPLTSMACGEGFTGEPGKGEESDGGRIAFGDGSPERDSAGHDAGGVDARRDGASDDGKSADGGGVAEAGTSDTGATEAGAWEASASEASAETDAETDGGCPASKPAVCNGTCVNTSDDPQNCNGCGNACTGNPTNSQATCSTGVCGFACDPGYEQCGSSCLVAAPDVVHGVFVAPGGPSMGCGTPTVPCGTISSALAAIEQEDGGTKNIVYVAESATPYVEQLTLAPGVTIQGGWVDMGEGQWSHPCALDASQVVVQAPAGAESVVLASFGGSATLSTLTLMNEPSAPAAGQSLYGVLVSGSGTQLSLENVHVEVGTAGSGVNGSAGSAATGAVACTAPGDSRPGAPVGPGTAGGLGTYSPSGHESGGPGGTGPAGSSGDNGGDGQLGGSCTPTGCKLNIISVNSCLDVTGATVTGDTGSPGCGGNGGQGGTGGSGGGSSIAVYAWGSGVQVNMTNASLVSGNGGAGGAGGPGGGGAPGVTGAAGASRSCQEGRCASSTARTCTAEPTAAAPGGAGGSAGGTGGSGGTGGGGAGGDSYCYYAGDGATVTGAFQCQHAAGGAGGAPNGPAGAGAANN